MPKKSNPWWAKVIFDEFVLHFMNKTDEQIVKDIRESLAALLTKNADGDSFGSKMVRLSLERIKKNSEIGYNNKVSGNSEKPNSLTAKLPEQLTYGARENVYLTQDQFNDLAAKVGNLNEARDLIDNLSYKLAEGSHKSNDHFATLCYWNECRKANANSSKPQQSRFETVGEHNLRVMNEVLGRIDAQKRERENGRLGKENR